MGNTLGGITSIRRCESKFRSKFFFFFSILRAHNYKNYGLQCFLESCELHYLVCNLLLLYFCKILEFISHAKSSKNGKRALATIFSILRSEDVAIVVSPQDGAWLFGGKR